MSGNQRITETKRTVETIVINDEVHDVIRESWVNESTVTDTPEGLSEVAERLGWAE